MNLKANRGIFCAHIIIIRSSLDRIIPISKYHGQGSETSQATSSGHNYMHMPADLLICYADYAKIPGRHLALGSRLALLLPRGKAENEVHCTEPTNCNFPSSAVCSTALFFAARQTTC